MFTINDDLSIYVTRGDKLFFTVTAEDDGAAYVFQPGDIVRFKVYGKKDATNVVLQKDFPVTTATEKVEIYLTEDDTKIGSVISKPKDYWYEVELNPYDHPQTIIGYDEDGAKVFRLLPEGRDLTENEPDIKPEDIPVVDKVLDMTSLRPVQNQAIARAVARLDAAVKDNKEAATDVEAEVAVERARIDNLVSGATADGAEVVDVRVGADGGVYATAGGAVRGQVKLLAEKIAELNEACVDQSVNLYDSSLQTGETKSPHYWVNGAPYETTQFDSSYNCTAPIPVEQMTKYTLGLVPAKNGYVKPWAAATSGAFFFDEQGNYISGTTESTFVTPNGAKTMRFNYAIASGLELESVNQRCMLVKGDTLPDEYSAYHRVTIEDRLEALSRTVSAGGIQYKVSGDEVSVSAAYATGEDILVTLKKKGGNNIFDFYQFATFAHGKAIEDLVDSDLTIIQTIGTDWHAPFIVKAVNNADGDMPSVNHFTGGNHEYTNTGSGGTATGRTASVKVYADNSEVTDGCGACRHIEIKWTNYVQATNTKKADGTGREVLIENHALFFDGVEWKTQVEVIPLEDIIMATWYGLQATGTSGVYKAIRYVGATNRGLYDGSSRSICGDDKATKVICCGEKHKLEIEIDPVYDLGDRRYYNGTEGIFCEKYGKVYFNIIGNARLAKDCLYCLRGKYKFSTV